MILRGKDLKGVLVRADTGERIPWACWADLDTGEFGALVLDMTGQPVRPRRLYQGRCPLKFIAAPTTGTPRPATVAPAVCRVRRGVPISPFDARRRCQHYACDRPATWKVSDEQETAPVVRANGRLCETAQLVGTRWYCDWHYLFPRLFDGRGELIGETVVRARPD